MNTLWTTQPGIQHHLTLEVCGLHISEWGQHWVCLRFYILSPSPLYFEWVVSPVGERDWREDANMEESPIIPSIYLYGCQYKARRTQKCLQIFTCLVYWVWRNFAQLTVDCLWLVTVVYFLLVSLYVFGFFWEWSFVFVSWYGEIPADPLVWSPSSTPALINQQTV